MNHQADGKVDLTKLIAKLAEATNHLLEKGTDKTSTAFEFEKHIYLSMNWGWTLPVPKISNCSNSGQLSANASMSSLLIDLCKKKGIHYNEKLKRFVKKVGINDE